MSEFTIFHRDEGTRHEARGSVMYFKALSDTTLGRFSVMERYLPPGGPMPPPHRHTDCVEAFFVEEGEVTFILDGTSHIASIGDFVLVPGGASHTFANRGTDPARILVLHSPAMDDYFAQLEELWSKEPAPTREQELELMSRFGMEPG